MSGTSEAWEEAAHRDDYRHAIHPTGLDPGAYSDSGWIAAWIWLEGYRRWTNESAVPRQMLDFGCGDGRVAGPLSRLIDPGRVVAHDSSATMLRRLGEQRYDLEIAWLLAGYVFDAVHSAAVFIHQTWAEAERLLTMLAQMMSVGALAGIDFPVYADGGIEDGGWRSVTTWGENRLRSTAEHAGLTVLEMPVSPGSFSQDGPGEHHGAYCWFRRDG